MKLTLFWRDVLMSLSPKLVDELDQLVASMTAGWSVQHTPEGAHKDITATSVTCDYLQAPRVVFSGIYRVSTAAAVDSKPLYVPLATNFLWVRAANDGSTVLYGLDATGRKDGEIVLIYNIGSASMELRMSAVEAPDGTQFYCPASPYTMFAGDMAMLVYSRHEFFNKAFWNVVTAPV